MNSIIKHFLYDAKKFLFVKHRYKSVVILLLLVGYYFCLPKSLFNNPTSSVIESREGILLGAKIANDEQWRFPANDSVPYKFKQCIIQFEDGYFYHHPGFNPVSIAKAFVANIKSGKVVRGASTLTQQVIRLSREGKKRTYFEKLIELVQATRLELRDTKDEILTMYLNRFDWVNNAVGIKSAAQIYFNKKPINLDLSEAAMLVGMLKNPALYNPNRRLELTQKRRDVVLYQMKKLLIHLVMLSMINLRHLQ